MTEMQRWLRCSPSDSQDTEIASYKNALIALNQLKSPQLM